MLFVHKVIGSTAALPSFELLFQCPFWEQGDGTFNKKISNLFFVDDLLIRFELVLGNFFDLVTSFH